MRGCLRPDHEDLHPYTCTDMSSNEVLDGGNPAHRGPGQGAVAIRSDGAEENMVYLMLALKEAIT